MRKATTLWIDTTNGANTPKRWNGSAWAAVTDKAATDAANAAVKANDAAKTAQSTADKAATAAANAASQANQAQAAAKKAQTTADGKNLIYRGPDEPSHDGLKPGDMWWRTQKYWTRWQGEKNNSPSLMADFYTYWQGAPNNSPSVLVPLSDRVVEVLTWDGTRFTPFDLVANNILASGTVAAKHLAVDSVTAEKVKANAITTDKLAANSVTAEKLVADAVTAAKLAANSVQARNIVALAITTDKLAANSVTTAKLRVTEDMTVALLNVHKIHAGDIVAGAITTDKLAANSVNADKLAANSVNADKIVSGAITTDKIAANAITAVKIAAGSITTDKVAAGQFRGYVFTGAIFQSSEAANTGVKLNSTALQMWDSNHNPTVYLDGEGKSNVLTGTFQTRISGHRVRISPDYRTSLVGGTETFVGDGIEFPAYKGETAYWKNPAIASAIQSNQVGEMANWTCGPDASPSTIRLLSCSSSPGRSGRAAPAVMASYRGCSSLRTRIMTSRTRARNRERHSVCAATVRMVQMSGSKLSTRTEPSESERTSRPDTCISAAFLAASRTVVRSTALPRGGRGGRIPATRSRPAHQCRSTARSVRRNTAAITWSRTRIRNGRASSRTR